MLKHSILSGIITLSLATCLFGQVVFPGTITSETAGVDTPSGKMEGYIATKGIYGLPAGYELDSVTLTLTGPRNLTTVTTVKCTVTKGTGSPSFNGKSDYLNVGVYDFKITTKLKTIAKGEIVDGQTVAGTAIIAEKK